MSDVRSDRLGLVHLSGHLTVIVIAGVVAQIGWWSWWTPGPLVIEGIALVFLFTAFHESVHRTAFRSRGLNDAVAMLCGAVIGIPSRWFRLYHAAHHRWTHDPEHDPELAGGDMNRWVRISGLGYWRSVVTTATRLAAGRINDSFVPPGHRRGVIREARGTVAVYAVIAVISVFTGSTVVLRWWLLPVLIGQPFLRAYLMCEHDGLPFVPDMARNTRTTETNALVRFIAWNMPYHRAHHERPNVPFHALPALHQTLSGGVVDRSYLRTAARLFRQAGRTRAA